MKNLLLFFLLITSGYTISAQKITLEEWNEEAKENIRCLPKYGHAQKSPEQLSADSEFIQRTLPQFANKRIASEYVINLGFQYLYHDVKKAMYRFNQAYLLDSTNSNIYWGYGAVYLLLGDYPRAREQYEEGLLSDPDNFGIMTDYGTYFMMLDKTDSALFYFNRSYHLDSTYQSNLFKMAVAYYYKEDCSNAIYYYEKCKSLGELEMTKVFIDSLLNKCKINFNSSGLPTVRDNRFAILRFIDSEYTTLPKNSIPSFLVDSDFTTIDHLLTVCIDKYNQEQTANYRARTREFTRHGFQLKDVIIDLKKYYRQYIPVKNENGEKEVWVNCFCTKEYMDNWRNKIITVMGGGDCFFNVRLNLTRGTYLNLRMNGNK